MNQKIITLQELSNITDICTDTLRTWLQGYRFTKFWYYKNYVIFNQDFIDTFADFLELKHRIGLAKYIKKYYKKISCQ